MPEVSKKLLGKIAVRLMERQISLSHICLDDDASISSLNPFTQTGAGKGPVVEIETQLGLRAF